MSDVPGTWQALLAWLPKQFTEHRVVPTRILAFILYGNFGYPLWLVGPFNFLIVIATTGFLVHLVFRSSSHRGMWLLAMAACTFALSPRLSEIYESFFLNSFMICQLLFFILIPLLMRPHLRRSQFCLALALMTLLAFSLSAGLCLLGALLAGRLAYGTRGNAEVHQSRHLLLFGLGLVWVFFVGYKPGYFSNLYRPPWDPNVWYFFANLLSSAFGLPRITGWPAFGAALLVVIPLAWGFARAWRNRKLSGEWYLPVAGVGLCMQLFLVAGGRVGNVRPAGTISPRYVALGVFLDIICIVLWAEMAAGAKKSSKRLLRAGAIAGLAVSLVLVWRGTFLCWDIEPYESRTVMQNLQLRCIQAGKDAKSLCQKSIGMDPASPLIQGNPWFQKLSLSRRLTSRNN